MSSRNSALPQTSLEGKRQANDRLSLQSKQPSAFEDDLQSTSDSESLPGAGQHAELYDSEADEQDQKWVEQQRQGRRSDAILSCPGCLTTVCVDCQRHEYITTQYRAMFVTNCRVSTTPKLASSKTQQKAGGKRQRDPQSSQSDVQEQVFPVFCGTCDAELGVLDAEEVIHFHSVFPSTA
ncbi:hypothetical protein ABBQ32_006726 [Trebouxia sp. C0010 RCD-2024]